MSVAAPVRRPVRQHGAPVPWALFISRGGEITLLFGLLNVRQICRVQAWRRGEVSSSPYSRGGIAYILGPITARLIPCMTEPGEARPREVIIAMLMGLGSRQHSQSHTIRRRGIQFFQRPVEYIPVDLGLRHIKSKSVSLSLFLQGYLSIT